MEHLGVAIREARNRKGLSLRTVAAAAEVSPSLLSQVETGKTHPSVGTLYAVVNVLGVSLDELLGLHHETQAPPRESPPTAVSGVAVQRREDNPTIAMENGVAWERLAVDGRGMVDALITTYAPGGSSSVEGKLMRHSGIEYGFIIEGELTLKLDFETYVLRQGDSLCFDSLRPHLYENRTDSVVHGLWYVLGRTDEGLGAAPRRGNQMNSAVDVLSAMGSMPDNAQAREGIPATRQDPGSDNVAS